MDASDAALRLAALRALGDDDALGGLPPDGPAPGAEKPKLPRIIKAGMIVRNGDVSGERMPLAPPEPVYPEGYIPPDEAHRQAQAILAEAAQTAQRLAEEARQQGQQEGYQAGFEQGRQEALAAWSGLIMQLKEQIEGVVAQRQAMLEAAEPDVVRLVLLAASKVIQREARHPDLAAEIVRQTLPRASEGTLVRVRVSPADLARLTATPPMAPGHARYDLQADPAVGQGGCLIDTTLCSIDATFRLLFEEVARELMRDDPHGDPLIAAELGEFAQLEARIPSPAQAEGAAPSQP